MKVSNCCDYNIGNKPLVHIGVCPECNKYCTYREVNQEEEISDVQTERLTILTETVKKNQVKH